ncbi:hypothetical protein ABT218_28665 [Streptomyces sp. NPDC001455]|uniref:hypothetical protein n=1 Tax=Streptomyces sp. NPDC001455 TaxID=3154518 RepID=UPI003324E29B
MTTQPPSARRVLLASVEAAAAIIDRAEADEWLRQIRSGIADPVVTPLPWYGLLLNGELHSVYATRGEAERAAVPGMEIRTLHPRPKAPGGGQS